MCVYVFIYRGVKRQLADKHLAAQLIRQGDDTCKCVRVSSRVCVTNSAFPITEGKWNGLGRTNGAASPMQDE